MDEQKKSDVLAPEQYPDEILKFFAKAAHNVTVAYIKDTEGLELNSWKDTSEDDRERGMDEVRRIVADSAYRYSQEGNAEGVRRAKLFGCVVRVLLEMIHLRRMSSPAAIPPSDVQDLNQINPCEAVRDTTRPGRITVAMKVGAWNETLFGMYEKGFTILEVDEGENPIRAYRKG